eukprot:TRINITY_DN845_c0_g1_i1.p1 TRINITY_DN845_c0_g1~~TRINITY_DN845_c0_g1_i1.p1  ORF type:complete len:448 (-),score=69.69 TRINITY_DN845_c0_g1_i1:49-1392(-)
MASKSRSRRRAAQKEHSSQASAWDQPNKVLMQMEVAVNSVGSVPGHDTMDSVVAPVADTPGRDASWKFSFAQDWPMSRSEKVKRLLRLDELLQLTERHWFETDAGNVQAAEGHHKSKATCLEAPAMRSDDFVLVHCNFLSALLTVQTPLSESMRCDQLGGESETACLVSSMSGPSCSKLVQQGSPKRADFVAPGLGLPSNYPGGRPGGERQQLDARDSDCDQDQVDLDKGFYSFGQGLPKDDPGGRPGERAKSSALSCADIVAPGLGLPAVYPGGRPGGGGSGHDHSYDKGVSSLGLGWPEDDPGGRPGSDGSEQLDTVDPDLGADEVEHHHLDEKCDSPLGRGLPEDYPGGRPGGGEVSTDRCCMFDRGNNISREYVAYEGASDDETWQSVLQIMRNVGVADSAVEAIDLKRTGLNNHSMKQAFTQGLIRALIDGPSTCAAEDPPE